MSRLAFKKSGRERQGRFTLNGRRVTGVVTDLPQGVKYIVWSVAFVVFLATGVWGGWALFGHYYFHSQQLFVLRDINNSVSITTGKTLTPDLVCEVLGLREGLNLFSLPIEQKRRELLEQAPNIRDISIMRRMPDKIRITIIEREPIARVGGNGMVVDEEGVVFIRYAGTGGLPLIKGADELLQVKPGDRLHGNELAAVRLVHNTLRPECRVRLLEIDTSKDDYLLITFSDHRQAIFAWKGMGDDDKDTTVLMQRQIDELAQAMENEIGQSCLFWDASHHGRIFGRPPGIE